MLRVLSGRRQHGRYEKLTANDEAVAAVPEVEPQLRRSATLSPQQTVDVSATTTTSEGAAKIHPFLAMLDGRRRRKKDRATPKLVRYLEYLKEGGVWDAKSDTPRIYYK